MRPSIDLPRDRTRHAVALLAVLVLIVIGCGGAASAPVAQDGGAVDEGAGRLEFSGTAERPVAEPLTGSGSASGNGAAGGNAEAGPVLDVARPDLLIIKTGALDLQVEAVDQAVIAAAGRITALGGYVSGSEQVGEGESVTATITYRIPADRWEEALAALRSLAIKVVTERTGTEDVTGQVVDLRARIANLQATEQALQGIMTKATKISDVLAVQAELTTVRGQIEEATAQRQRLEEQAALSTLTVRFSLQPEPAVVASQKKFDPKSEVDRATASLVEILQGLATAGIWFGIVWLPILLVLVAVVLVVALVGRRRLSRRGPDSPGAGPFPPAPPPEPVAPPVVD
ncbi:MAG: hypothetical protein C0498_05520 [Anaerolinea sp.]|nr:hypothetical protein [Anaerolinea sp.]